jgi:phage gp36-like protein
MTTPYATQEDIAALYGADALFVADRDGNGTPDARAVARALASATDEVNSYLAVRYTLPLPAVPGVLVQAVVDIALYRLALSKDVQSKEHRQRYDDAIARLRDLAAGKAQLVLPVADTSSASGAAGAPVLPDGPQPIVMGGPERLFSRDRMRGL